MLTKFTSNVLMSVPGMNAQVKGFMKALDKIQKTEDRGQKTDIAKKATDKQSMAPDGSGKRIEGYEMQDVSSATGASSAPIPYLFLMGFLVFIGLIAWGFRKR
jgi:cobaltochelatase CobN